MIRTHEELNSRAMVWRGIAAWCVIILIGVGAVVFR